MAQNYKIKKQSAADLVCEKMKELILRKEWNTGEKIPSEMELAESFGVNRLTVRIALQRLHTLGLLDIRVGDGTYVRSLCRDIADKSGNLGIMSSLVREQVGKFELSQCQTLEEIEEKGAHLYSISEALAHLPRIDLEDDFDVKCGKHLRFDTDADRIVLYYENQAMAVYERHHGNVFACARGLWS